MGILCVTNLDKLSQFDTFRPTYSLCEVYILFNMWENAISDPMKN